MAGLLLGGYLYLRLDDEIRRHVELRLSKHYQHLNVHIGSARFDQNRGITIYDLSISEPQRDNTPEPLLSVDELFLSGNVRMEELLAGEPKFDRIVIQRATLRAVRRRDGRWSVKTLLPLPKFNDQAPVLAIADATLILEDAARPRANPFTLRGVDATFTPASHLSATGPGNDQSPPCFRVEGSVAGAPARSMRFKGELDATGGSFDVTFDVNGLEITPELLEAIPGGRPAELQDVQIQGRADLQVRVIRAAGPLAQVDWTADVTMARGRLDHPGLPQPVTDLAVRMTASANQMSIKQLTAKLGTADVTLACDRNGWSTHAPLGMAVRLVGLTLDGRLRELLPASIARLWDRFQPAGTVDAEARIAFDGERWSPELSIQCHDISLTDAERFPYQVHRANGRVVYRPAGAPQSDVLTFDLTGSGGGRPIHIAGEFTRLAVGKASKTFDSPRTSPERSVAFTTRKPVTSGSPPVGPAPGALGWLEISGTEIPIHDELLDAMPEDCQRFVRSLRPQGTVDFRWRADWTEASPHADVTQEIQLKNCSIQYERFRYPLHHINGRLTERNRHWKLHGIESRGGNNSTAVVCHGELTPLETGRQLDLVFQATDVPLDESLRDALIPEAQSAWSELQPQGRVDFTAHIVHKTGQAEAAVDVVVRPRDRSVSIEPRSFPYRFEQLDGEASFAAGRVDLRNVRARHDSINYSASQGTWQPTSEGGWQLALQGVNGDRLRAHRDLLVALPPRMQKLLERLQPSGTFNLINSSLSFEKQARAERFSAAWDVWLDCHQATLHGGIPLENITGAIRLIGRDDGQTSYAAGELAIDSLIWRDLQFTNVRGPMWIDRSVCLFGRRATAKQGQPSRPITADAYGGSLAADASLQHDGNTRYQIETAIGGADLTRFANERLGGPSQLSGTVSGRLSLEGAGSSTHALNGTGELHIVDANIYELPVLVAMLKVLRNPRTPDTTAFNQCDTQFTIQGEHVHFQQLNLVGDAVSLYGRGEANFDRDLNLVFYSLMGPADLPIPFLKNIAGQASEQILQLKVDGTMDSPQIHREALPAVNQVWNQIQNQLQAGAATVVPAQALRSQPKAKPR